MKWMYDACGKYCMYKKFVIVKQIHPSLSKYTIYKENSYPCGKLGNLIFIDSTDTLLSAKQIINKLKK